MPISVVRSLRMPACLLVVLLLAATTAGAAELKTRNVVLIATDGLRRQEVFTGADKAPINKDHGGVADPKAIEERFWRETRKSAERPCSPSSGRRLLVKDKSMGTH